MEAHMGVSRNDVGTSHSIYSEQSRNVFAHTHCTQHGVQRSTRDSQERFDMYVCNVSYALHQTDMKSWHLNTPTALKNNTVLNEKQLPIDGQIAFDDNFNSKAIYVVFAVKIVTRTVNITDNIMIKTLNLMIKKLNNRAQ